LRSNVMLKEGVVGFVICKPTIVTFVKQIIFEHFKLHKTQSLCVFFGAT